VTSQMTNCIFSTLIFTFYAPPPMHARTTVSQATSKTWASTNILLLAM
jgi:hypothetical protein